MAIYSITISDLEDKALTWKATKEKKTKAQVFDGYVVKSLLASWIREMLDEESKSIRDRWDFLTQAQKDQIKTIAGV
jgi:hypothetical protein